MREWFLLQKDIYESADQKMAKQQKKMNEIQMNGPNQAQKLIHTKIETITSPEKLQVHAASPCFLQLFGTPFLSVLLLLLLLLLHACICTFQQQWQCAAVPRRG